MKERNITHLQWYHWISMSRVIAYKQARHKEGDGLFLSAIYPDSKFYLAYPFTTRSRRGQNYSCHLKAKEGIENQEETTGCCSYMAEKLLMHFECFSALKCLIKRLAMQIPDIMFAPRIGSSKQYTSQHWQAESYKFRQ